MSEPRVEPATPDPSGAASRPSGAARPSSLCDDAAAARETLFGRVWALPVALFAIGAGSLDAVSTAMALDTGRLIEANPVVRVVQEALGPAWVAPKLALHAALGGLAAWLPSPATLATVFSVSLIAALVSAHNLVLYFEVVG